MFKQINTPKEPLPDGIQIHVPGKSRGRVLWALDGTRLPQDILGPVFRDRPARGLSRTQRDAWVKEKWPQALRNEEAETMGVIQSKTLENMPQDSP